METQAPALRVRPRERRGDRTRARLVEAGLAEMRDHGIESASIARIAKAAGVSRPTFYFHFPKKEDLLRELIDGFAEELADHVGHARTLSEAFEALIAGIGAIQERLTPPVFAEMLRVQTRESVDEQRSTDVLDAVVPFFRKAAEDGVLRPGLEPERAASICLASLFGCLLDADAAGRPDDLRALVSLFLREAPERTP